MGYFSYFRFLNTDLEQACKREIKMIIHVHEIYKHKYERFRLL